MSSPEPIPIHMQRNEDLQEVWEITDEDEVAIDITGYEFRMKVKTAAGVGAAILTLNNDPDTTTTGFHIESPASAGQVTITILAVDINGSSPPIDGEAAVVKMAYDVLMEDAGGLIRCIRRGEFVLEPGCA